MVASVVSIILENIAVVMMWFGNWYGFYIVQKEVETDTDPDVEALANIDGHKNKISQHNGNREKPLELKSQNNNNAQETHENNKTELTKCEVAKSGVVNIPQTLISVA